jgi:laccase
MHMVSPGQTTDVLVTFDQAPRHYYLVVRAYARVLMVSPGQTTDVLVTFDQAPRRYYLIVRA